MMTAYVKSASRMFQVGVGGSLGTDAEVVPGADRSDYLAASSRNHSWVDLHRVYIPFPGLPNLLLSATHLVVLHLWNIPNSSYLAVLDVILPMRW